MSRVLSEPITALESAGNYKAAVLSLNRSVDDVNRYFLDKGVQFSAKEQVNIFLGTY
jgi:hypothetical protein